MVLCCITSVRLLYTGVSTHLRVGPLGLDLLSHLLCTAQQVITLPALQIQQTSGKHSTVGHYKNSTNTDILFVQVKQDMQQANYLFTLILHSFKRVPLSLHFSL